MGDLSKVERGLCPHLSTLLPELWGVLVPQEKEQLLVWSSFFIFKKGECIIEANRTSQNVFILVQGQVIISKDGYGDRSQIVRLVRPVEVFGYHTHFSPTPDTSSATAVDRCVVCMVPIHILEDILKANPKACFYFLKDLAHKLTVAENRTVSLTQKHTRGRLAESLLLLREKYGLEQDEATISIYLSRQELANLSNMTISNAIRTLYAFEEERILALDGRKIKILDEAKLVEISHLG